MIVKVLSKNDKWRILCVLYNLDEQDKLNKKDILKDYKSDKIDLYFRDKFYGVGCFSEDNFLMRYCFIKYPMIRPETLTVVHKDYRNMGIAKFMRDIILTHRTQFYGNIVYSAVELNNLSSLKSILNSGYSLFDVTKDGYLQLVKVLPYKKET